MWRHWFVQGDNMGYQIVFTDIDGTLLNGKQRILDSTLYAIEQLQAQGIPLVPVTARGPFCVDPILERYGLRCPMICYSGAAILDEDHKVIQSLGLSREIAVEIIDYIEDHHWPCVWNVYTMDQWIVKDRSDARVALEESIVEVDAIEGSMDLVKESDVIGKLLCMCEESDTDAIETGLKEKYPQLSIVRSSDILIEIMDRGISKGQGIRTFCKGLGVKTEDTVAFGDHYNDVDMLETVGMPFLMENAPKELKKRIKNVTLSNEDGGIYDGLYRLGLIHNPYLHA